MSEVLREIAGDRAQWTFSSADDGTPSLALIRIGDEVWTFNDEDGWEPFPVVPRRLPLLVWVNGYVNGPEVRGGLDRGEAAEVAGIPATIFRGGVSEMTETFPGKMRDRELVDDLTSFTYWVDDCGDLLRADVVIELGGEERQIAIDVDLPTRYRYQYLVYDIGAELVFEPPRNRELPIIPPPPSRDLAPPVASG